MLVGSLNLGGYSWSVRGLKWENAGALLWGLKAGWKLKLWIHVDVFLEFGCVVE